MLHCMSTSLNIKANFAHSRATCNIHSGRGGAPRLRDVRTATCQSRLFEAFVSRV